MDQGHINSLVNMVRALVINDSSGAVVANHVIQTLHGWAGSAASGGEALARASTALARALAREQADFLAQAGEHTLGGPQVLLDRAIALEAARDAVHAATASLHP